MIKYKFENKLDKEFASTLRSRMNSYFSENEIQRSANTQMVIKTIVILSMYLIPYFLLILGGFTNLYILAALWIFMGIGKAFTGTAIMHDSLHGSYSKNKFYNTLTGLSATLVGADRLIWQIQHNVLHHTYTNIEDADEDILPRVVFRYSVHQPHKWFHRYQHIYAPIFYCVPLLEWLTTKDFIKPFDYLRMGLIKKGAEFRKEFAGIVLRKVFYWAVFIALPIMLIGVPVWITILMILGSHCISGNILAMIFQTAHVVEPAEFVKVEGEHVKTSWVAHQLKTTCNYGTDNKVLSWFLGGLNFQIEHHLFPDVCHVHYPKLAKMVKATAKEFGLPYNEFDTFGDALVSHFTHLKEMGSAKDLKVQLA
ncbi:MAG: acyl-CoA desaturase [Cyclobacteriaceae bacterium]